MTFLNNPGPKLGGGGWAEDQHSKGKKLAFLGSQRAPHRLGLGTWRLQGLRSVLKQPRLGAAGRGFRSAVSWVAGVVPACIRHTETS